MAGKQMGEKHERRGQQSGQKRERAGKEKQQSQGNFGQDEARQQREKETELSHMGEMTRKDERQDKPD
jgi:hypothetical protein